MKKLIFLLFALIIAGLLVYFRYPFFGSAWTGRAALSPFSFDIRLWIGPATSGGVHGSYVVWELLENKKSIGCLAGKAGAYFVLNKDYKKTKNYKLLGLGRTQAAELSSSLCQGVFNYYDDPYLTEDSGFIFIAAPQKIIPSRNPVVWRYSAIAQLPEGGASTWKCVSTMANDAGCQQGVNPFEERAL